MEGNPTRAREATDNLLSRVKTLHPANSGDNPNTSIAFWVKPSD